MFENQNSNFGELKFLKIKLFENINFLKLKIWKFKFSKFEIFENSNNPKFRISKIQIFENSSIQQFKFSKIQKFVSFENSNYNLKFENSDIWLFKYTKTQIENLGRVSHIRYDYGSRWHVYLYFLYRDTYTLNFDSRLWEYIL